MNGGVIDCFLFYNEKNIALYRFKVLWNVVKYFVVAESAVTFMGKDKPFYLDDPCFDEFRSKIVPVRCHKVPFSKPDISKQEQWENETNQRNILQEGVSYLLNNGKITNNDFILLNDVDEIPDIDTLDEITKKDDTEDKIYVLRQKYHCYTLETVRDHDWYHSKMFTVHTWKNHGVPFSTLRLYGVQIPFPKNDLVPSLIVKGGWHLSYFGDVDFINNKLQNFSHQEVQVSLEQIVQRKQNGTDIMGNDSIAFKHIPVSCNDYLPPCFELL